jgi:hypothetical protein
MSVSWTDLQTRGFVVVRSLLTPAEVDEVLQAYERSRRSETLYVSMVARPQDVKFVASRLAALLPAIREATDIRTDTLSEEGFFFPTDYTKLGWHTDHKSYYTVQDHYHYLNFWMPILKPRPDKSGLGLVPMDRLREAAPDVFAAVVRRGAASVRDGVLRYETDDGRIGTLPCPDSVVNAIAVAPDVSPGDVIVARTDVLHKTQDAETTRVALTMRGMWSEQPLSKKTLFTGSPEKHQRMLAEPVAFRGLLACFWIKGRSRITLADCRECFERVLRREWRASFLAVAATVFFPLALLPHRIRSMRRESGSWARAVADLVRLDARYRRASREMRRQGAAGVAETQALR